MNKYWHTLITTALIFSAIHITASIPYASQSTITDAEGYACMGDDKSRKQTEQAALADAKKSAVDKTATYIKSETKVEDFVLQKDIIEAYQRATVKILQEIEKNWYKDANSGDCYKLVIKAEVIPDEKAIKEIAAKKDVADDPLAPLGVKVWSDKKDYQAGEKIKVYLKGNKPFHARVVYKDAGGRLLQLLPNPYRRDNYFNGGVIYEIPSGNDRFELEVEPPFGEERIVVYASSSPLGDIEIEAIGGVYQVKTAAADIPEKTRSVKIIERPAGKKTAVSEFLEVTAIVRTSGVAAMTVPTVNDLDNEATKRK